MILTRYDEKSSVWKAKAEKQPDFIATSKAPYVSILMGNHAWTIHNDSKFCSDTQTYTR